MVPFLAKLVRVDFWTQLSVAFVCVRTRKFFFSPNGLKVIPFDSARRAESIGAIFSPFGEGRIFDPSFSGVCVCQNAKNFFSPNGLKVIPFDSSRRAESNDIILSPFREKKFFDRKFSKSKFLYLEIFSNSGQICDPPRAGRDLIERAYFNLPNIVQLEQ